MQVKGIAVGVILPEESSSGHQGTFRIGVVNGQITREDHFACGIDHHGMTCHPPETRTALIEDRIATDRTLRRADGSIFLKTEGLLLTVVPSALTINIHAVAHDLCGARETCEIGLGIVDHTVGKDLILRSGDMHFILEVIIFTITVIIPAHTLDTGTVILDHTPGKVIADVGVQIYLQAVGGQPGTLIHQADIPNHEGLSGIPVITYKIPVKKKGVALVELDVRIGLHHIGIIIYQGAVAREDHLLVL